MFCKLQEQIEFMTELLLKGPDKKIKLLKTLAGEMGVGSKLIKKKKERVSRRQANLAAGIKEALKEVELAEQGKIKLTSWSSFKKELKA